LVPALVKPMERSLEASAEDSISPVAGAAEAGGDVAAGGVVVGVAAGAGEEATGAAVGWPQVWSEEYVYLIVDQSTSARSRFSTSLYGHYC
jgi:hypothetical protein